MKLTILAILILPIALSFLFSTFRAAGFDPHKNCRKVGIDILEPVISTRWFCEVE